MLCRPRRFGKSLLVSTLEAYFLGKKELFAGLEMEELEQKLESYLSDWESVYGCNANRKTFGDRFQYVLEQAYKQTGRKVVVLIDEYAVPLPTLLGCMQIYQMALQDGHGDDYKGAMIKHYEDSLGVKVRKQGFEEA